MYGTITVICRTHMETSRDTTVGDLARFISNNIEEKDAFPIEAKHMLHQFLALTEHIPGELARGLMRTTVPHPTAKDVRRLALHTGVVATSDRLVLDDRTGCLIIENALQEDVLAFLFARICWDGAFPVAAKRILFDCVVRLEREWWGYTGDATYDSCFPQ